jgi:hypothetical protein
MLARLTSDPQHLRDLFQLEAATNERLLGDANLLPGITVHELVFGTPDCNILNAAFTRARPAGSRFNGADRGACTAPSRSTRHRPKFRFTCAKSARSELGRKRNHNLPRVPRRFPWRLHQGSAGVIYPSVRHRGGTCLACFRPALVVNVRRGWVVTLEFSDAFAAPTVRIDKGRKRQ